MWKRELLGKSLDKALTSKDVNKVQSLLEKVNKILKEEPSYKELPLDKPIVFVGDTHGDYETTKKVIKKFSKTHLLVFLGDYVDISPYDQGSLKNITYLLEQKVKRPENIILLRGNHEFETMFKFFGFGRELSAIDNFQKDFQKSFEDVFSNMPYAAYTKRGIVCMHGGLPDISSVDELESLPKGVKKFLTDDTICQIVWNDNIRYSYVRLSPKGTKAKRWRGSAFLYGEPFFSEKMNILGKNVLVRAHDFGTKGYSLDYRILTLSTCKSYADTGYFKGIYVAVIDDPKKEIKTALDLRIEYF